MGEMWGWQEGGGGGGDGGTRDHVFTELTADAGKIQLQPGGCIPLAAGIYSGSNKGWNVKMCFHFYLNRLMTDTCISVLYTRYI